MKKVTFQVIDLGSFLTYIYGGVYINTNLLTLNTTAIFLLSHKKKKNNEMQNSKII